MKFKDRVIFLGASNLSRSFSKAVSIARSALRAPLSIHAAMGRGRSYSLDSGFLGKKFSNFFSCGIWESLAHEEAIRTTAFVTDVGNDLAYEAPVEAVLESVTTCVERLQTLHAQVVITALPITALERLSQVRFLVLRGLFYPKCRLGLVDFVDRAQQVNEGLVDLAKSQKISIFTVPIAWYGFDPIHFRSHYLSQYWRDLFALSGHADSVATGSKNSLALDWYLRCLTALNKPPTGSNESDSHQRVQFFDGTQIALY